MAIIIKIKSEPEVEKILLKARKSIDGNIIVSDHPDSINKRQTVFQPTS